MDAPAPPPATLRADPLADATIARILGPTMHPDQAAQLRTIGIVNRAMATWQNNGQMRTWRCGADVPADVADALHDFVAAARANLPAWADTDKIARAEARVHGRGFGMSCTTAVLRQPARSAT